MSRASGIGGVAFFCLKFLLFSCALLFLWWWKVQPYYVTLIGHITGAILEHIARVPIEGMLVQVNAAGVLSSETDLVWIIDQQHYPINAGFLVVNIPPYIALVLATPGLALKRIPKILLYGLGILATGHILFLSLVFVFSRQIQESPEVPTAIGLFLMTLPFMLWIVFAYWDKLTLLFEEPEEADGATESGEQGD